MTDPEQRDVNKPAIDTAANKAAQVVAGKPLDKPLTETASNTAADVKDLASKTAEDTRNSAVKMSEDAKATLSDTARDAKAAASETVKDAKDSLQDGFSRFDQTARKVSAEAAEAADDVAGATQAYAHQGLDSLNRAGTAIAGAITQRPLVALVSAMLGGAMIALARR